jgi:hypothetical protein
MSQPRNRREFLREVGQGMLLATIGPALAADLGLVAAADAAATPESSKPFSPMQRSRRIPME